MARSKRRRRRSARTHLAEISLTPLIDTALTLLIIFMITTPMLQNAIKVELPQGAANEAKNEPHELVVFIDKAGTVFFDGESVTREKLTRVVGQKAGTAPDQTIFVKADKAVDYGTVMEIVDQVKHIEGVRYVALATEKTAT